MGKFIKRFLCLFIFIIILGIVLNIVIKKKNIDPDYYGFQYQEIYNRQSSINAIIIGSSHATHGIRPELLNIQGYSFYNFALNGSNPEFHFNWYKEIFRKKHTKPEYIIYCVDWFIFDEKILWRKYEQDSEYFSSDIFINNLLRYMEFNTKLLILNRFPVLKHKTIEDLIYLFKNNTNHLFKNDYNRGYISYEKPYIHSLDPSTESMVINQINYFKKFIDLLMHDKVKIIFVNIPEYGSINDYKSLQSMVIFKEIATKYNLPFLNYNIGITSNINNQREYYSDWEHLNSIGSYEFSKMLRRDLLNIIR
ncbi:MAG: hypothetical protein A2Y40_05440 [Candidatus Margulisbacteria bacterium GWF2_35_9]|nr:MAG: hypothetical protein A2Y40_05440 [Candidatus Margulisbacteria bacterium GWF2_35_9]